MTRKTRHTLQLQGNMHTLAVSEQGTSVHAEGDMLVLKRGENVLRRVRAAEIEQVLLFGGAEVTCRAMGLLLRRQIDLVLLTQNGNFRGRLSGRGSKNVQLRLAQYQRSTDPVFCLRVARAIVAGKLQNQRQVLLRAQRRLEDNDLAVVLGRLRVLGRRLDECADLDVLRGYEGQGAALYFSQLGKLIRNQAFQFTVRSRRPPRDPANALLSFGYAVLGGIAETELYRCGLDPMLGFFHQPAYGRPSLMLDLLEEFRPTIDTLVLRVINRRQVGENDFERRGQKTAEEILAEGLPPAEDAADDADLMADVPWDEMPDHPSLPCGAVVPAAARAAVPAAGVTAGDGSATPPEPAGGSSVAPAEPVTGVYLSDVGRKVFLSELFRRLRERLDYPPRDATLELRDILRQQIYHAVRVIEQKDETYAPFTFD